MTFDALLDVQEVMFRAYVRNVMFFATLPYHLTEEMRRHHAWDAGTAEAAESTSVVFLDRYRNVLH